MFSFQIYRHEFMSVFNPQLVIPLHHDIFTSRKFWHSSANLLISKSLTYLDSDMSKLKRFFELTAFNIRDNSKLAAFVNDNSYIFVCSLSRSARAWSVSKFYRWYKRSFYSCLKGCKILIIYSSLHYYTSNQSQSNVFEDFYVICQTSLNWTRQGFMISFFIGLGIYLAKLKQVNSISFLITTKE